MTRPFRKTASCPKCGEEVPLENAFSAWLRAHPMLCSGDGYTFYDQDFIAHKYKTALGREFQCLMFVEVKRLGDELTPQQRDSIYMVDQILRNRRTTPTSIPRRQCGLAPLRVYSALNRREVEARAWGYHVLRIDGATPDVSSTITWDKKNIDCGTLVSLLRFDLDPDTLLPFDARRHHVKDRRLIADAR